MPTILDATVVNQAYDTSGNGGRKLVRLSNGWLVALVKNHSVNPSEMYLYKSIDNGQTWARLCYFKMAGNGSSLDAAITNKGNTVYIVAVDQVAQHVAFYKIDATTQTDVDISSTKTIIDSVQTAFNGVSLAINSAGTELHAAWASKNSTYPNSFNIRYAKGTINADGSVTWGAVEQWSTENTSGYNNKNPSVVIKSDGKPLIVWEYIGTVTAIRRRYKDATDTLSSLAYVYNSGGTTYVQSSPSACVAPNGRIWVAWHGDHVFGKGRIMVSYSDDGGVTWSTPTILTSTLNSHAYDPSITASRSGDVFVLFQMQNTSIDTYYRIYRNKFSSGSWGSNVIVAESTGASVTGVSTLYDLNIDIQEPLFIYKGASKVGFYGTWTAATISVTPGYIGQKTSADKSNILSYSITTDGTMSDITEKINGVTIATRTNPTSGQQFTVSLTQEQWDAIKFGNGHTLTIEMNGEVWTYTFDKRLHANDDVLSAVKGVQDLQTHLNGIKAQLAAAIRAKGGTVNDTDAWSAFVSAVGSMPVKKFKSGTFTVSGSSVAVTGLGFYPRVLMIKLNDLYLWYGFADYHPNNFYGLRNGALNVVSDITRNSDGFTIPNNSTNYPNGTWQYYAGE